MCDFDVRMPCWYFEKRELRNTPSFKDGIDSGTEARYRREGARFIIDAGTKMNLRYDTCATGVVYFHRFYMFHSFKEFHRYITAACCLFLAGKVEETPKKIKDLIKVSQSLLSPELFVVFGDEPKEEVITMERILLQTIKFDLQVDHPYGCLLKFGKVLKGDKEKIQKLVQMAWTFINDSLCTSLCLIWEPEIIAVALMYLATRLSKFDIQDWQGKVPGSRQKWYDALVEGINSEIMEDICHKVLDLYSPNPGSRDETPPVTPVKGGGASRDTPPPPPPAQQKNSTPVDGGAEAKVPRVDQSAPSLKDKEKDRESRHAPRQKIPSLLDPKLSVSMPPKLPVQQQTAEYSGNSGYDSQMYSSSFMSGEGSKNIQNLMTSGTSAGAAPGGGDHYGASSSDPHGQYAHTHAGHAGHTTQQYGVFPAQQHLTPQQQQQQQQQQPAQHDYYQQQNNYPAQTFNPAADYQSNQYSFSVPQQQQPPPQQQTYAQHSSVPQHHANIRSATPTGPRGPPRLLTPVPSQSSSSGLAHVRITGRR